MKFLWLSKNFILSFTLWSVLTSFCWAGNNDQDIIHEFLADSQMVAELNEGYITSAWKYITIHQEWTKYNQDGGNTLLTSGLKHAHNHTNGMKVGSQRSVWMPPTESRLTSFLGEPKLDIHTLFEGERFPNVVVATDGSVLATWGRNTHKVRRSENGGRTWGPEIVVGEGFHGGGATVDELSGDILVFVEDELPIHDPSSISIYRSKDHGKTWKFDQNTVFYPLHRRSPGFVPTMHMSEHGITLKHDEYRGRLLRTANHYLGATVSGGPADAFTCAIYSDDGGVTWDTSGPFPAFGTNEAAVAELSNGWIIFISRRHFATDGLDSYQKHIAWSYDGGETWRDLSVSPILPDGNTNSRYGLMHGLIRLPVEGRDILIFSNIESHSHRERGTVWASFDGGKTWPLKRLVEKDGFAYSSLAAGRKDTPSEGWIYLLYETGPPYGYGNIAKFNLSWILEGELTGNGDIPGWVRK